MVAASIGVVIAPTQGLAAPRVPPAFRIAPYTAASIPEATALARSPSGTLYVTTQRGVVRSIARPGARPRLFVRGLRDSTLGVTFLRGRVYVSDLGRVVAIPDAAGDGVPDGPARVILGGLPTGRHQNDAVVSGPGGRLFLGVGSTCDACRERHPWSGTILSFRPDGGDVRVVARGLRNPYGLAFDAAGRLWATDEGRDEPDGVPEELNRIVPGGRYGWPDCWGRGGGRRCAGTRPATVTYEPHSAVTGLSFAAGRWGAAYRGNAFIAHWGTYRGRRHGRYVTRTRLTPRGPVVSRFVTGLDHPIATLFEPGGALLVADYGTGRIWRVTRRALPRARPARASWFGCGVWEPIRTATLWPCTSR